jgi:hypothetical protein
MSVARYQISAVALPDGRVLVEGAPAEIYDPTLDQWSSAGAAAGAPVLLTTGQVLAVQGLDAKLFDPTGDTWSTAPVAQQRAPAMTAVAADAG